MDIQETLTKLVGDVVGNSDADLIGVLVGDVLAYYAWYGSDDPDEVQVDFGDSLTNLVDGDMKKQLLAKTIRRYIVDSSSNKLNADEATRLTMERIVRWKDWYPEWAASEDDRIYQDSADDYSAIYDESDYGLSNTGPGVYFP